MSDIFDTLFSGFGMGMSLMWALFIILLVLIILFYSVFGYKGDMLVMFPAIILLLFGQYGEGKIPGYVTLIVALLFATGIVSYIKKAFGDT